MIAAQIAANIDWSDLILELLSVFAYVFIIIMAFYAKQKNPIFKSKGFPVMIIGIVFGFTSAIMDFVSEIIWFDQIFYDYYKLVMATFQIIGLAVFAIALILVFRFQKFLMGDEGQ